MNREILGSVTDWEPGSDSEWAYDMALRFLSVAAGDPPPGARLDVAWLDHELGSYPSIVVDWPEFGSEPREFVRRAEQALWELNQAVDWGRIRPSNFVSADEEENDIAEDKVEED